MFEDGVETIQEMDGLRAWCRQRHRLLYRHLARYRGHLVGVEH